ncbi:MAG: hypothetical protein WC120_04665 [Parcubacteria group bacterium]
MTTLAYIFLGSILAVGVNLGWSWWIILPIAIVGVGLVVWALDAADWLKPALTATITIAVILAIPPTWRYTSGHLPLAVFLSGHRWMAIDTKVSVATTSPAVAAKAAALTAQTVREDEAAAEVARLFKAGKTQEALEFIQKLAAEGQKVRAVVSGDEPPAPPAPVKTNSPAKTTPPPVKKAAKVATAVPVATTPVTVGATPTLSAPPAATPPAPEIWKLRFYRGNQIVGQKMFVTRTGTNITMRAELDPTVFQGSLRGDHYEGTVSGDSNGTFSLYLLPNGEATGEVYVGQRIIFSMKRLS